MVDKASVFSPEQKSELNRVKEVINVLDKLLEAEPKPNFTQKELQKKLNIKKRQIAELDKL